MNKLLLLSLSLYTTASLASSHHLLNTYNEVLHALSNGSHLQAIAGLSKCSPASTDNIQLGGIDFNHFLVYTLDTGGKKNHVIGMSNTIFVNKKELGYVFEYVKLRIFEDNSVEFFSQNLNPKDYSSVKDGVSYKCKLAKDVKLYEL